MIPKNKKALWRNDNVEEKIDMQIDASALDHIMTVLTDLYSDPIMAIIREISTNARDSHIDAGVDRPIEVALPTLGHRQLVIEDFGLGLSRDDIHDIFSRYGASTKRDSNAVTGQLGLGCKSPLTYTNSYTITAVKDGELVVADVTKNEKGVGSINIVDRVETDKPNGVKVTVPVRDVDVSSFRNKAEEFFYYWRGGVLIDGEVPEHITPENEKYFFIDPDVAITRYSKTVVMGGVPYKVPGSNHRDGWIAWVDMGEVDFTPSREQLHMTEDTNETIKLIESFIAEAWDREVKRQLDEADNDWDRLRKYEKIRSSSFRATGRNANFREIEAPKDVDAWNVTCWNNGGAQASKTYTSIWKIAEFLSSLEHNKVDGTVILDFPYKSVSPLHKDRLARLFPGKHSRFHLVPEGTKMRGYRDMPHISWEDVPEIPKKERAKVVRQRTEPTYPVYHNGGLQTIKCSEIPKGKLIGWSSSGASRLSRAIPDAYIVDMEPRRLDKFKRLYPDALSQEQLIAIVQKMVDKEAAKVTDTDTLKAHTSDLTEQRLRGVESKRIQDPDLVTLLESVRKPHSKHWTEAYGLINKLGGWLKKPTSLAAPTFSSYFHGAPSAQANEHDLVRQAWNRYPLLFNVGRNTTHLADDLVEYVNFRYLTHYNTNSTDSN